MRLDGLEAIYAGRDHQSVYLDPEQFEEFRRNPPPKPLFDRIADSNLSMARQLAGFAMTSAGFRASEFLVFLLLHHIGGTYYLFAAGGTLCFSMVVKYFVYGSWLFAGARR